MQPPSWSPPDNGEDRSPLPRRDRFAASKKKKRAYRVLRRMPEEAAGVGWASSVRPRKLAVPSMADGFLIHSRSVAWKTTKKIDRFRPVIKKTLRRDSGFLASSAAGPPARRRVSMSPGGVSPLTPRWLRARHGERFSELPRDLEEKKAIFFTRVRPAYTGGATGNLHGSDWILAEGIRNSTYPPPGGKVSDVRVDYVSWAEVDRWRAAHACGTGSLWAARADNGGPRSDWKPGEGVEPPSFGPRLRSWDFGLQSGQTSALSDERGFIGPLMPNFFCSFIRPLFPLLYEWSLIHRRSGWERKEKRGHGPPLCHLWRRLFPQFHGGGWEATEGLLLFYCLVELKSSSEIDPFR